MKRKDVTRAAIHRSSVRAAAASAAIENRIVPVGYVRAGRLCAYRAGRAFARSPQTDCLMGLVPGYGQTPVAPDDLDALKSAARIELGDDPTMAEFYDYEQAILTEVRELLLGQIVDGTLDLDESRHRTVTTDRCESA